MTHFHPLLFIHKQQEGRLNAIGIYANITTSSTARYLSQSKGLKMNHCEEFFCSRPSLTCSSLLGAILLLSGCAGTPEASVATTPSAPPAVESRRSVSPAKASASAPAPAMAKYAMPSTQYPGTFPGVDRFPAREPNEIVGVAENPVSTFSIDVDTASYAFVRRALTDGRLPQRDAVRVEEMVNYFPYSYPIPTDRSTPFTVTTSVVPCPWASENRLLHIALQGYDIVGTERPRANVVLLIDTSGSMGPNDRLPLLKQGFRLLVEQLRNDDHVAIVTYAGQAKIALESTPGSDRQKILDAIDNLHAYGSTAGADGLQRAYALAERNFDRGAVNRVILATDGDFNVGISSPNELEKFIASKRKTGIYLSIFGVGLGNLNDALMQRLAHAGNGNAAYIDSLLEARKAMNEELASTLFPIANDVKVQVEFNPAYVATYRLIGYETRMLRREDFKNDKVDAGDIGAGHSVTAIYEITPVNAKESRIDPLRYQPAQAVATKQGENSKELAFVKLRYKLPGESASNLVEHPVSASSTSASLSSVSSEQRFAIAVAAFAQRLRGESALDGFRYSDVISLANSARGLDAEGYRAEFVRLVRMAETIDAVRQR